MVERQDVKGHGGDGIDINFGIHKLQEHAGEKAGRAAAFCRQVGGAVPDLPGQKQHVGGAQNLHHILNIKVQPIKLYELYFTK